MRKGLDRQSYTLAPSLHSQVVSEFQELLSSISLSGLSDPAMRFKVEYQRDELLSKYNAGGSNEADERRTAAIRKWQSMELRNAVTNVRLLFDEQVQFKSRTGFISSHKIARTARRTIERVLGETPDLEVLYGTFTSGASTSIRRRPDGVAVKFKVGADVTARCLNRVKEIYDTCDTWRFYRELANTDSFVEVTGGILFTVPKNSEIDRVAVKEPDLNMFCQKGVGAFIRKRLRTVLKVDLNDQTRNQELARIGSIDGSLATLDLSSASDLISDGLVRLLLPAPWFDLLDDIRSSVVEIDGIPTEVNMFSSMGNAFTFELESLIFWAIANAVAYLTGTKGTVSVYGDDIIVPTGIAGLLVKVLQYYGLKVNTKKSFWRGPFRESCGKHWYLGTDVTPFYVREPIGHMNRLIHFLNRLRAWAVMPKHGVCDDTFFSFWKKWSRKIPTCLYGGWDTERIDALVSLHPPRMRLVKVRQQLVVDPLGGYLHWLRAADSRPDDPISEPLITSSVMVETEIDRLWRNTAKGAVNTPFFPSEWIGYGGLDAELG